MTVLKIFKIVENVTRNNTRKQYLFENLANENILISFFDFTRIFIDKSKVGGAYSYLFWSIIAIGTVIVSMNIVKKK